MGERVVVGGDGGVFVGGFGALIGLEEGEAALDAVFGVAGLMEDAVGGVGEGCGYGDGEDGCEFWLEVEARQGKGDAEAQDGCEDGEESPGELEEGKFGAWFQRGAVSGVRRRVMAAVRVMRGARRREVEGC